MGTVAASRFPRAAPQKHKVSQWFFKGPLVESGWGAMAHLAPGGGMAQGNMAELFIFTRFYKGFSISVRF